MVLLGAIIGEDALQNKDKAIRPADVAPRRYTLDDLAKSPMRGKLLDRQRSRTCG